MVMEIGYDAWNIARRHCVALSINGLATPMWIRSFTTCSLWNTLYNCLHTNTVVRSGDSLRYSEARISLNRSFCRYSINIVENSISNSFCTGSTRLVDFSVFISVKLARHIGQVVLVLDHLTIHFRQNACLQSISARFWNLDKQIEQDILKF